MKAVLSTVLLLAQLVFPGSPQPPADEAVSADEAVLREIDGVWMVSAQEAGPLLGLDCAVDGENILFRQDNLVVKLRFGSSYVYRDRFIQDILERPPVTVDGQTYVPLDFFTDYLKAPFAKGDGNRLTLTETGDFSLYERVKFLPKEVMRALQDPNYPHRDKTLQAVELPRSMKATVPRINDYEKVINPTPLTSHLHAIEELNEHGYTDAEIVEFTMEDYTVIRNHWPIPEKEIQSFKSLFPELQREDLSQWTYGEMKGYSDREFPILMENKLPADERNQLKQRGILFVDFFYLMQDFGPDNVFTQPDEILRKSIEKTYQSTIDKIARYAEKY